MRYVERLASAGTFGKVLRYEGLGFPFANQAGDQELAVWRGMRLYCLNLQCAG